ncbi:MAG: choice-of-anchor D domain-containing protein [Prevotella sp.]|nr:choice-of-anchor D domain-containing protein [Prevotella sp.]
MTYLQRYAILMCLALFLPFSLQVSAQSTVSLTSSSGHPGDEVEISVSITGAQEATALQAVIPHSPQLSYVESSAKQNTQITSGDHLLSVSDDNSQLRLYIYSINLTKFQKSDGTILTFRLKLGNEPATYELKPEVILSNQNSAAIPVKVSGGKVTINCPKISLNETGIDYGSVPIRSTHTKNVTVKNVGNETLNVSEIKAGSALFTVSPSSMSIAAGNSKVLKIEYTPQEAGEDHTDISIKSDASNGNQIIHVSASPFSVNTLSVANASGQAGEEVTISVSILNMEPIIAAQCSFTLPEVLKYVEGSATLTKRASADTQISGTVQGDKLSFYIHSLNNTPLSGHEGELFTFKLLLDGTGGSYTLNPEDVILSNTAGQDMTSSTNGATIRIAAPKMVCDTELDFGRVPMEKPITKSYVIKNTGQSSLTIQRIEFTDNEFSLSGGTALPVIPAGGKTELVINYQPLDEGDFDGIMQIYSNDPENQMQAVKIKGTAYYTNQLELQGKAVDNNPNQYTVTLSMRNTLPIVGIQFDIHWVPGMTTSQDLLSLTARAKALQTSLTQVSEDCYRVYIYSLANTPIASGEGSLISILYNKVKEQINIEGTTIVVDNIILSTADEQNHASSSSVSFTINSNGLIGDVNNDGMITIADVICIINNLLTTGNSVTPLPRADVNHDGKMTIADVVGIINLMLQQTK